MDIIRLAALLVGAVALSSCRTKRDDTIAGCIAAIDDNGAQQEQVWRNRLKGVDAPLGHSDAKARILNERCAPLYLEPGCRNAIERFTEVRPDERIRPLIDACKAAYCPHLSEPKPRLCQANFAPARLADTAFAWHELDEQILRHDHGGRAEPVLEARRRATKRFVDAQNAYLDAGSPPYARASDAPGSPNWEAGGATPLHLTLLITTTGASFRGAPGTYAPGCQEVGPGPTLPAKQGADGQPVFDYGSITTCARRLKQQFPSETSIAVVSAPQIDYRTAIACIDAVRKDSQGDLFPDVTFGGSPGYGVRTRDLPESSSPR